MSIHTNVATERLRSRNETRGGASAPSSTITRLIAATAIVACLLTSACNTIEGAGKDVQSVGESTSQAARDVRDH